MNIKEICHKYMTLIRNGEVIDLDEMAEEIQDIDLSELCPELAKYLENLDEH